MIITTDYNFSLAGPNSSVNSSSWELQRGRSGVRDNYYSFPRPSDKYLILSSAEKSTLINITLHCFPWTARSFHFLSNPFQANLVPSKFRTIEWTLSISYWKNSKMSMNNDLHGAKFSFLKYNPTLSSLPDIFRKSCAQFSHISAIVSRVGNTG